jgi:hypothetical protein
MEHSGFTAWFLPMDVEAICSIPLSTRRLTDSWAWHDKNNGILMVRSVYRLLVEIKKRWEAWLDGRSSGSNTEREHAAWKCLLSVQVPSKLRVFLWRLAQQSLPTADIRCRRKMAETSTCTICGGVDSWRHSLIDCSVARCVWALAAEEVTEHLCMNEDPSAKRWLFSLMETMSRDDFARVAVTPWAIWYARRRNLSEPPVYSPLHRQLPP